MSGGELMLLPGLRSLRDLTGKPLTQPGGEGARDLSAPDRSFQDWLKTQREERNPATRTARTDSATAASRKPQETATTDKHISHRPTAKQPAQTAETEPRAVISAAGSEEIQAMQEMLPTPEIAGWSLTETETAGLFMEPAGEQQQTGDVPAAKIEDSLSSGKRWVMPESLERQLAGHKQNFSAPVKADPAQPAQKPPVEDGTAQELTPPVSLLLAWRNHVSGPDVSQVPEELSGVLQVQPDETVSTAKTAQEVAQKIQQRLAQSTTAESPDTAETETLPLPARRDVTTKSNGDQGAGVDSPTDESTSQEHESADPMQPTGPLYGNGQSVAGQAVPSGAIPSTADPAQPEIASISQTVGPEQQRTAPEERVAHSQVAADVASGAGLELARNRDTSTTEQLRTPELGELATQVSGSETSTKPASTGQPLALTQPDVAARLASYLRSASESGQALKIRLSPPELGTLQIEEQQLEGKLVARLEVETEMVKSLLLEQIQQLRDALQQQGLKLDQIDVDVNEQLATAEDQQQTDGSAEERQQQREEKSRQGVQEEVEKQRPIGARNQLGSLEELDIQV